MEGRRIDYKEPVTSSNTWFSIKDFVSEHIVKSLVSFLSMKWFPLFYVLKDSNKRVVFSDGDLEGVNLVRCRF